MKVGVQYNLIFYKEAIHCSSFSKVKFSKEFAINERMLIAIV